MRMRRKLPEEMMEFQIAPMVDVLLCILIFFIMITSASALRQDKDLTLPVAANSTKKDTARAETVLNVRWNAGAQQPVVNMEGVTYADPAKITPLLAPRVKGNPAYRVVIRAEKESPARCVSKVMGACAEAGIDNITFAVINRE